jgi:hypothetical protein
LTTAFKECLNEASAIFFGNSFSLTHDQAADVLVESFEQDINQANTCFLFDLCDNLGGDLFGIFAEDDDGILATGVDVEVGSSVQDVNQLNRISKCIRLAIQASTSIS